MNLIKKLFVYTMVFTMVTMLMPLGNVAKADDLVAGTLIKRADMSAVYYLYDDAGTLKRMTFPNAATYSTWFEDFDDVVTVTADELASFPLGKNAVYRPGTRLIKITTDPKVYAVEKGGVLRWIESEDVAKTLYGDNWASLIDDMPDAFYASNYNADNAVVNKVTATAHPAGTLFSYADSSDIWYVVGDGSKRKVTEAGFTANKFNADYVITGVADTVTYTTGTSITGAESELFPIAEGGSTTTPVTAGDLTVALAANTPVSRSIISDSTSTVGEALVNFANFNFTASDDGDVTVNTLKLTKSGISSDTDLDNVYLYEGDTRLAEGGSISSGVVTFNNANGLFTVSAGQTKTISVKADIYNGATAGKTIAMSLVSASDITTNAGSVTGTFPLTGNTMTVASVTDLGYVSVGGSYTTPTGTDTSVDPDQTDYQVWNFTLQSHNQALDIEKLVLTEVGSIQVGDLTNFKLLAAGTEVASASMANDYTVTFDLSNSPVSLTKGGSKEFSVRADIVKGSTKTFYFSFQYSSDIVAKDTNYHVYAMPYTGGTWSIIKPTGNYKIASGTVTVNKASTSPTGNVSIDATNVTIAIYDFKASGEDMKIKNLNVRADTSSYGGLDNGKILVDGVQVGSTKDLTENTSINFNLGSSFIIPAGETKKVSIVADIKTTTSTSYTGSPTIDTYINAGSSNAQGITSLQTSNVPSAYKPANQLTMTSAALNVTKYSGYGNQTVVAGTSPAKLGSFVLTAGASSAVSLNSITVALSSAEAATVSNMYIKYGTEEYGTTKPSPSTSNVYTESLNIPASGAVIFDLYASVDSGADNGPWIADISATGTANEGSTSVSASATSIQTITIGSGSLSASDGSQPDSDILIAGSTGNEMAEFTFSAANDSYTINKMQFAIENNLATSTAAVHIEYPKSDGSTVTADSIFVLTSGSLNYALFDGIDMYVAADTEATVKVTVDLTSISNGATSGANGKIYFDYDTNFEAHGGAGTTVNSVGSANLDGNTFYVRKSRPTFAKVSVSGSPSSDSALFKFNVVSDAAGNIDIKQLGFSFTTTGVTVTSIKLYNSTTGTAITDTGVNADSNGYVKLLVGGVDDDVLNINTTAKTYEVRGTVTGWGQSSDEIQVRFKQDTATTANTTANALRSSHYNIWSDRSATSHTTATSDWTNGYLLKEMTGTQTFTKS